MTNTGMNENRRKHSYSIETTRNRLGKIEVSDGPKGQVYIEGELGCGVDVKLLEGIVLQITGENGVFRIDLTMEELQGVFKVEKITGGK